MCKRKIFEWYAHFIVYKIIIGNRSTRWIKSETPTSHSPIPHRWMEDYLHIRTKKSKQQQHIHASFVSFPHYHYHIWYKRKTREPKSLMENGFLMELHSAPHFTDKNGCKSQSFEFRSASNIYIYIFAHNSMVNITLWLWSYTRTYAHCYEPIECLEPVNTYGKCGRRTTSEMSTHTHTRFSFETSFKLFKVRWTPQCIT